MPEGGEPSFYYKLNNEEIKSMCLPVNLCILNHRPSPTLHPLVITIIILKMDRISKNVQKNANNECKNGLKKNRENRRCNQEWTIHRYIRAQDTEWTKQNTIQKIPIMGDTKTSWSEFMCSRRVISLWFFYIKHTQCYSLSRL